tara:strand:+ start:2521 stop:3753 length:1233 start_codon:yes stop_codon:yes gene_type:complete
MSYYKFNRNDVFTNTLKTYPSVKFVVYSGSSFYNNTPNIAGKFTDPIRLTDAGNVSLFELNIDRVSSSNNRSIGPTTVPEQTVYDNGLIYPYVIKNGSRISFRTSTAAAFNNSNYGDIMLGVAYPYTSSISKEFYDTTTSRASSNPLPGAGYVSHIRALKNTINHYGYISPHFAYSSSALERNFDDNQLGLVSIPTIFYGSEIKKGTIDLKYYYTGTLASRVVDKNQDGVLYSIYGADSGSVVGIALYNEGFLILTGTTALNGNTDTYKPATDNPKWIYFAQSVSGTITAPSSSYVMAMSGTSYTQTLTMFATAPKGELNQSNNPTFVEYSTGDFVQTGSKQYKEVTNRQIKNVVSSAYADPTGSFEKTTYISKIGVYDKNKNLIGLAKLATPMRKTAARDFTFKIKVDI